MNQNEIDENDRRFLTRLYELTNGDPSIQASMYEIGEALGFDRNATSRVAEKLIGLQLVEIRTLSGGIGISVHGAEEVQNWSATKAGKGEGIVRLGNDPILDDAGARTIEQVAVELKSQAGGLGLDFDTLTELMADLKTMDAQLGSSRTKTAIIRECLRSMKAVLEKMNERKHLSRIKALLGE